MANTHGQPLEDPTPTPCKTHSHPLEDPWPTLGGPMANPWRTQRPPLGGPLTQLHLFEGSVGVVPGALAGVSGAGHAAGDLGLLGAQVYQQGGDLGLEVPRGRVPQDAQ